MSADNALKIINSLLALGELQTHFATSIQAAQKVLQKATFEGRDVTNEELDTCLKRDDEKRDELNKMIHQK